MTIGKTYPTLFDLSINLSIVQIETAFEYANDSILNAYFPHFKSVISPIWCPKSAMRLLPKSEFLDDLNWLLSTLTEGCSKPDSA